MTSTALRTEATLGVAIGIGIAVGSAIDPE
jgi:hypothetical protein